MAGLSTFRLQKTNDFDFQKISDPSFSEEFLFPVYKLSIVSKVFIKKR